MDTEDPIGVAGGVNLYQFNGNNPGSLADPFGLCPEAMRVKGKERECAEWNQAQVEKARQVIEENAGEDGVLGLPNDQPVVGVNDDEVEKTCRSQARKAPRTNRGCVTPEGLIIVNTDRTPENMRRRSSTNSYTAEDPLPSD